MDDVSARLLLRNQLAIMNSLEYLLRRPGLSAERERQALNKQISSTKAELEDKL